MTHFVLAVLVAAATLGQTAEVKDLPAENAEEQSATSEKAEPKATADEQAEAEEAAPAKTEAEEPKQEEKKKPDALTRPTEREQKPGAGEHVAAFWFIVPGR